MTRVYTWRFQVRSNETDSFLHTRPSAYQTYLEEAAIQASASVGFDYGWYLANHAIWVARSIQMRFYEPAVYGDELEMRTWVADFKLVQSNRDYDLRRVRDGAPVLRGRTNWVYLDTKANRPQRLRDDFRDAFDPAYDVPLLEMDIPGKQNSETGVRYAETHEANYYDVDGVGHVNNTIYAAWAERAVAGALNAAGWPARRLRSMGIRMSSYTRTLEFLQSAREGDSITVRTRCTALGEYHALWRTELVIEPGQTLLVADEAAWAFVDSAGRPHMPDGLRAALCGVPA